LDKLRNFARKAIPSLSFLGAVILLCSRLTSVAATPAADPWIASQTLQAAQLASELADKSKEQPTVVYVGFRTLFAGGHIPGASFHGTATTEEGLAELKKWAATLPRSTNLVIYCGCCPFEKCPNIRPAFTALHDMGFTRLASSCFPPASQRTGSRKTILTKRGRELKRASPRADS
jgi:hypothetical protein